MRYPMTGRQILMGVLALASLLALTAGLGQAQRPGAENELQPEGANSPAAAVDDVIPIQGQLTDASGVPLNGTYGILAAIYDAGGTFLCGDWQDVTVADGLFTMNVGTGFAAPCQSSQINGAELYLGITVGPLGTSEPEMTPRQPIYPVPYAWSLRPGAWIEGSLSGSSVLRVANTNTDANSVGLYVRSAGDANADLVLGANSGTDNDGIIISDPGVASSNIKLKSKSYVEITLDSNNDEGNTSFTIRDGTNAARFRVYETGNVYADGGYNCGASIDDAAGTLNETEIEPCLKDDSPADFAEMLPATEALQAGDVLVIGADGKLTRSTVAYQPTVVGVYSTRPSYLGNSQYYQQPGYAPLAIAGPVPVKASAENGAIQPGDLLVASSTPGHAMKAGSNPKVGTIIGKALQPLDSGTGIVLVLVTLQ